DIVELEKENIFHPADEIKLKQVKLESYNNTLYNINFGRLDIIGETKRIEAIVKSLDKNHIPREGYRSLVRIEHSLPREEVVSNARQRINREMKKNIPLTLVNLLQPTIFEPITEEPNITDDTIITNMLELIGKGGQRRITDILNYIVLLYIEQGILT